MSVNEVKRTILRWHGGKWLLAPWIISFFPKHKIYTEVYGGAASVLLRKERADCEIYNDLDVSAVNLFKVLREPNTADELRQLLKLTPFSRKEFELAYIPTKNKVESARRLIVRSFMGFGSNAHSKMSCTGFRARSTRLGLGPAGDWLNYPDKTKAITERLKGVVIECRDALELLKASDDIKTLHYVDPPYVHSTRQLAVNHGRKSYDFEMDDYQHRILIGCLKKLKGMVVLSGYDCLLYQKLLKNWNKTQRKALADGANPRVETLWFNKSAWENQPQKQLEGI